MQTIICPHCKKEVDIPAALEGELTAKLTKEFEEKQKEAIEEAKKLALEDSSKKLKEEFADQMKRTKEDLEAKDERIKKLLDQMTELTNELRESKKEKEEAKLEMAKKLAEEEDKIREDAMKKAEETQRLKIAEKEKQLQDALKEAEDMKRKLQQGSQQLQGETFEVEFEEQLRQRYPHDKISPVGKGIKGGDIIQEVWDAQGNYAGKVLWELKNTKAWSEPWIDKLKVDKRSITGDEAVIISEVLPADMSIAGFRNGVWVTQRSFALSLADTLRAKLIQLFHVKKSSEGKDTKMEILYSYLSGTEFKNHVEAIVEAFSSMQGEVEKEKRYFANKWARDEKSIRQVIDNTIGMRGDLQGIMGNALPQIKDLEVLELNSGSE